MRSILYSILVLVLLNSCLPAATPGFDYVEEFKKETAIIDTYVKANNIQAIQLTQGVWFTVDVPGTGIRATFDDTITVNYKMKLFPDNTIVDQSPGPVVTRLSKFIRGIQIAMPKYQLGSQGTIIIPSYWGYLNVQHGLVPPNSILAFEYTLVDVKDHQLKVDTTAIGSYLRSQNIAHAVDVSGLMYKINTAGSGIKPILSDSVEVTYTSTFFPSGNEILTQSTPVRELVTDLPIGACIGLLNMQEGSTATMYLPSSLAYGPWVNPGIPAKSNVVYDIHLIKVIHH